MECVDPVDTASMAWCVVAPSKNTRTLKVAFEQEQLYDKSRKIIQISQNEVAIPVKLHAQTIIKIKHHLKALIEDLSARLECKIIEAQIPTRKMSPKEQVLHHTKELYQKCGFYWKDDLAEEIPNHWEKHGDLIVLPENSFASEEWGFIGDKLWTVVADALGVKRLAKRSVITNNDYRRPKLKLLLGNDGWVKHVDNGITYKFDVTKCMFSSGNITEKIRIAKMDCFGQTIVDLYAGIGYFVLPYLIHAKACTVHACEWNPDAVEALRRNLQLNGVADKCTIYVGDNRKFSHKRIADHVNLGLIPSSEAGWPVACRVLRQDIGGWLHIHGNVTSAGNIYTLISGTDVKVREKENVLSSDLVNQDASDKNLDKDLSLIEKRDSKDERLTQLKSGADEMDSTLDHTVVPGSSVRTQNENHFQMASPISTEPKHSSLENLPSLSTCMTTKSVREQVDNLPTCNRSVIKEEWIAWSKYVADQIKALLTEEHISSGVSDWFVNVRHIEHVKSYAPRIDHLVLDVECRPMFLDKVYARN